LEERFSSISCSFHPIQHKSFFFFSILGSLQINPTCLWVGPLEKVVIEKGLHLAEQGLQLAELKTDMVYIKYLLLQMKNKKPSSVEEEN